MKINCLLMAGLLLSPVGAVFCAESPASRTATARDLVTLEDLDGLSVSPDGAWAAFQLRRADPDANRYDMAWYVVDTRGGSGPQRIADAGEAMLYRALGLKINGWVWAPSPVWSPDSRSLALLRQEAGTTGLWLTALTGGSSKLVWHGGENVVAAAFSRDGRRLLFQSAPGREAMLKSLRAEEPGGYLYDERFFPAYSTEPITSAQMLAGTHRRLRVYELQEDRVRDASKADVEEFDALRTPRVEGRPLLRGEVGQSRAGRKAWTEARDPKLQGGLPPVTLVASAKSGGEPIVCTAQACTAQIFKGIWWRGEDEVIFARLEGDFFLQTAVYAWRPSVSAPRLIVRTADKLFGADFEWRCDIARSRLICLHEASNRPRDLVAVDLDTGRLHPLVEPNASFRALDLGPEPRLLTARVDDNLSAQGYLVLPPRRASGRLPLVVVTYRCRGFLRGGQGDEYPVYPLAAQGFAVLCFDMPHPDERMLMRQTWDENEYWSRGPGDPAKWSVQRALDAAVAQLDQAGIIDPKRVGVTGLSFGGEIVMFALFNMNSLATAIASGTEIGPSSAFLYGPGSLEFARATGLDSPRSERWRSLSVAWNADRVQAPLLLNVPDHELVSAVEVYAALKRAGRAVEMIVHPDEYHIKGQPAHRLAIYQRNIDWMNFWLRGVEDDAPAKEAQYRRWRALRENRPKP